MPEPMAEHSGTAPFPGRASATARASAMAYPALHRLIKRGWIEAEEGVSENNRRAKFYCLTAKGKAQLAVENTRWDKFARAIARIMRPAESEAD